MNISLDYDNTYTADPVLWNWFISAALTRGHKVYCVTSRTDKPENHELLRNNLPNNIPVIFCNHNLKKEMTDKKNIYIDVWIDDIPEDIGPTQIRGLRDARESEEGYESVSEMQQEV